jgi:hypothetical protein
MPSAVPAPSPRKPSIAGSLDWPPRSVRPRLPTSNKLFQASLHRGRRFRRPRQHLKAPVPRRWRGRRSAFRRTIARMAPRTRCRLVGRNIERRGRGTLPFSRSSAVGEAKMVQRATARGGSPLRSQRARRFRASRRDRSRQPNRVRRGVCDDPTGIGAPAAHFPRPSIRSPFRHTIARLARGRALGSLAETTATRRFCGESWGRSPPPVFAKWCKCERENGGDDARSGYECSTPPGMRSSPGDCQPGVPSPWGSTARRMARLHRTGTAGRTLPREIESAQSSG